jgi:hypothetical protein
MYLFSGNVNPCGHARAKGKSSRPESGLTRRNLTSVPSDPSDPSRRNIAGLPSGPLPRSRIAWHADLAQSVFQPVPSIMPSPMMPFPRAVPALWNGLHPCIIFD